MSKWQPIPLRIGTNVRLFCELTEGTTFIEDGRPVVIHDGKRLDWVDYGKTWCTSISGGAHMDGAINAAKAAKTRKRTQPTGQEVVHEMTNDELRKLNAKIAAAPAREPAKYVPRSYGTKGPSSEDVARREAAVMVAPRPNSHEAAIRAMIADAGLKADVIILPPEPWADVECRGGLEEAANDEDDHAGRMAFNDYANREDWLAARPTFIGASEAPSIAGFGAYADSGPSKVWLAKVGMSEDATTPSEKKAKQRGYDVGHASEAAVCDMLREHLGIHADRPNPFRVYRHQEHQWAACTPDGKGVELGGGVFGVEVKTAHNIRSSTFPKTSQDAWEVRDIDGDSVFWGEPASNHWEATDRKKFMYFYLQCQWSLFVTGWDFWYLAILSGTWVGVYRIHPDKGDQDALFKASDEFWRVNVQGNQPPPVLMSDPMSLNIMGGPPKDAANDDVELPAEAMEWFDTHTSLKGDSKALKTSADYYREKIARLLGDSNGGVVDGVRIYRQKAGAFGWKLARRKVKS